MMRQRRRLVSRIAMAVVVIATSLVATQQPAAAWEPPCWTTLYPSSPSPGEQFTMSYRNCSTVTLDFTSYFTNGASVWVHERWCRALAPGAWDYWGPYTAAAGITFGMAHCSPYYYPTIDWWDRFTVEASAPYPPCYTSFSPPNPGPNAYMVQEYRNCADRDVRVAPAYRDAHGALWTYTNTITGDDACTDVWAGLSSGSTPLNEYVAWRVHTSPEWASYTTVFCV
jgi:hypothetical protein